VKHRPRIVRRDRTLDYFTIAWNAAEGLVAVIAGWVASSISLVGFGIASFIEVTSGTVLLWRMSVDTDVQRRERNERRALKIVGTCFLALAAYITYESAMDLWSKKAAEHSIPGIILACVSLIVAFPMCRRVSLCLGRDGSISGNDSGDIFIAFSTANPHAENGEKPVTIKMLPNDNLDAIFAATVQAVEESIINAMIAAETMTGI
jgi:hypothetical protein